MVAGFIMSNKVYIYGEDETNINHYDDNGSYWEFINMGQEGLQNVLDSINNHYGKEYNTITIMSGPMMDVENWNAYEKIEIQTVYLKIPFTESLYAAGYIEGKTFTLYGEENDIVFQIKNENGEVANTYQGASTMLQQYIIPKIREKGYEVESSIIDTTSYNIGDIIPNWEQYINVLA